jgi:hypothetical protein
VATPIPGRSLDYSTGLISLTDQQQEFLEWLCGARAEGDTQTALAERLGVSSDTLRRWKKDPSFLQMWQERMVATHAHPDTLSKQLQVLNEKALSGDTKAIELYWKLVDKMTPDKVVVESGTKDLSDADLAARLEAAAQQARRQAEPESPQEQAERVRRDLGLKVV